MLEFFFLKFPYWCWCLVLVYLGHLVIWYVGWLRWGAFFLAHSYAYGTAPMTVSTLRHIQCTDGKITGRDRTEIREIYSSSSATGSSSSGVSSDSSEASSSSAVSSEAASSPSSSSASSSSNI